MRAALEESGTAVGVAGRVEAGSGVVLDGEETDPPAGDAAWPVYRRSRPSASGLAPEVLHECLLSAAE